jgi:hypothetical protein
LSPGYEAGICHEIGLIEVIDQAVGSSVCKVSCEVLVVQAMVLNALGFSSRALYLMPQYLANKPAENSKVIWTSAVDSPNLYNCE